MGFGTLQRTSCAKLCTPFELTRFVCMNQMNLGNKQPLFYYASTHAQSSELQRLLIESPHPSSVTFDSCTCCVVKPHATKDRQFGLILDHIISQVSCSTVLYVLVYVVYVVVYVEYDVVYVGCCAFCVCWLLSMLVAVYLVYVYVGC